MTQQGDSFEQVLAAAVQRLESSGGSGRARRPGELALEFDEAYTDYVGSLDRLPTDAQLQSLQALDAALTAMTSEANPELWTEQAVVEHPRWLEVRSFAAAVSSLFGWSCSSDGEGGR